MAKQQKSGGRCSSICWLVAAIAGGALIYEFLIQLQQEILTSLLAGFGGMVLVGMVLSRLLCRDGKAKAGDANAVSAEDDAASQIRPKRYNELKVDKETTERPDITAAAKAGVAGIAAVADLDMDDPAEDETAVAVQPVKPEKPAKTPTASETKPTDEGDGDIEVERVVASIKRAANGEQADSGPVDDASDGLESAQPDETAIADQAMAEETVLEPAAEDSAEVVETEAAAAEADSETAVEIDVETDFETNLENAVEAAAPAQDAAAKAKAVADRIKAIASEVEAAEAEDLAAYARAEKVAVPDASRVYTTAIDTDEAFHQKLVTLTARAEAEAQQAVDSVHGDTGQDAGSETNVETNAEPEPEEPEGYSAEPHEADATPATGAEEPAEFADAAMDEPAIAETETAPPTGTQPDETPQRRAIVPMEPNGLDQPIDGMADDLTQIDGIGAIQQTALNRAGIYHFAQFTSMNRRELAWLDANMQIEDGQPGAEAWRKQAIQISRNSG